MQNFVADALEEFEVSQLGLEETRATSLIKGRVKWKLYYSWYFCKNDKHFRLPYSLFYVCEIGDVGDDGSADSEQIGVRPSFLVTNNMAEKLRAKCNQRGLIKFETDVQEDIGSEKTKKVETSVFLKDFIAHKKIKIGGRIINEGEVYTKLIFSDIIHHMPFDGREYDYDFRYNWQDSDMKKWIEANAVQKLPKDIQDILYERSKNNEGKGLGE